MDFFGSTVRAWIQRPSGRDSVPEFLLVFVVFGCVPRVSGLVSCPPGPILESVDRNLRVGLLECVAVQSWGTSLRGPGTDTVVKC